VLKRPRQRLSLKKALSAPPQLLAASELISDVMRPAQHDLFPCFPTTALLKIAAIVR
jgi:ABC-type dipeptide/oligopeptide/nickel transport system ATPase subunit